MGGAEVIPATHTPSSIVGAGPRDAGGSNWVAKGAAANSSSPDVFLAHHSGVDTTGGLNEGADYFCQSGGIGVVGEVAVPGQRMDARPTNGRGAEARDGCKVGRGL